MPPSLDPGQVLRSPVFELGSFALGLIVGSFANVCIHRIPLGESVVSPPSRCPRCRALIRPWDNVPVLSYLWLRGRCRRCQAPISGRYPLVEVANGLAWLALAWRGGPTLQTAISMLLVTALLVLALIDLDHHLLPNVITLPGIAVGLLASFLPGSPVSPTSAAASALGGYLCLALVAKVAERVYGEEALGQGDWKMTAMLGAFLGWAGMLLAVFLGTLAGALVGLTLIALGRGSRRTRIPLGTFLAVGALVVVFSGPPLIAWYRGLLGG
jgi:leader peptidase (prepilin peptidase) / N-methyltransferase